MYWEPEIEQLRRADLQQLQLERLRETVGCAGRSPFYRQQFAAAGVAAERLRHIDDIRRLPFTTKDDLRNHFPYGFLTVPKDGTVRLHCSSGTTGNPTVIFHNRHDLASWANLVARSLYCAGVRPNDVFQNICGYGLFTGGLGFQYGAERLGALAIPAAAGNSRRQIKLMQDFGTTAVHTIPSYLMRLHGVFAELGLDPRRDTELRVFVIGAEPHTEGQRRRIEELFGVKAYNSYGLSEMNGPGVAFECTEQNGLHIWEDCFVVEIIDPETLEPLPDGELGELVLTTLDRQAMPLLRYRTRDLTRILPGPCPCGRSHRRLDRISGRSDDMLIIKGCNIFPMQIEKVLMRFPEVGSDYLIVVENRNGNDEMTVQVELQKEWFTGNMEALENLSRRIGHEIRDEVLVTPAVQLLEPGSLPKSEGKAVRVQDLRKPQEAL
ncbi:MAG: phenylacetate--CoA ligase [Syntrophotaleaceae bacterium]